jgi:hypothetical protein
MHSRCEICVVSMFETYFFMKSTSAFLLQEMVSRMAISKMAISKLAKLVLLVLILLFFNCVHSLD